MSEDEAKAPSTTATQPSPHSKEVQEQLDAFHASIGQALAGNLNRNVRDDSERPTEAPEANE